MQKKNEVMVFRSSHVCVLSLGSYKEEAFYVCVFIHALCLYSSYLNPYFRWKYGFASVALFVDFEMIYASLLYDCVSWLCFFVCLVVEVL